MATRKEIQDAYIDYVLTEGERPKSVYVFARQHQFQEQEFYTHFGSFDGIEQSVWSDLADECIREIRKQEVWPEYSAREKALSFFYSFFELIKSRRSFVVYSLERMPSSLSTPLVLTAFRDRFESFAGEIIDEGIASGELADRRFFAERYKHALWLQLGFVLKFWVKDASAGFEKTDEAIERGVNVTFDLFETSAFDNLLDYGKFIFQNRNGSRQSTTV
ncbi:MAG: TetR/AcrR family transcriptional regulator [Mucilaginibacter polytrichastri]|nr:TetR/AcrR family transcriptional regulator [Mucilaginibacter polytrichastri]